MAIPERELQDLREGFETVFAHSHRKTWRKPFGLVVFAYTSLLSLPPLFILFLLSGNGWHIVTLKVLSGIWLVLTLLGHLLFAADSDKIYGFVYRKNRAMYVFVMICTALMLWNPGRAVFFSALAGVVFFSIGYIIVMQIVFMQFCERQKIDGAA